MFGRSVWERRSALGGLGYAALVVTLIGVGSGPGFAQQPTLEQAVTVERARARAFPVDIEPPSITPISTRLATIEEIRELALSDVDGDGVLGLLDACPVNPDCQTRDDISNVEPDGFTGPITAFESQAAIVQAALEENAEKALYEQADLVDIAEEVGFHPDLIRIWRQVFVEGKGSSRLAACRVCHVVDSPTLRMCSGVQRL